MGPSAAEDVKLWIDLGALLVEAHPVAPAGFWSGQ